MRCHNNTQAPGKCNRTANFCNKAKTYVALYSRVLFKFMTFREEYRVEMDSSFHSGYFKYLKFEYVGLRRRMLICADNIKTGLKELKPVLKN
jgi:hypothetical protein